MKTLIGALALTACLLLASAPAVAQEVVRTDHYVTAKSTAPGMQGGETRLYVREVALKGGAKKGVVLFVHGAGTPAEVSFDVPYTDYSWMAYLAKAGFDVFAVDMTGYGRSTRPFPMDDPCNMPSTRHGDFPKQIGGHCEASFLDPITTMGSDWNDIDAVVDHLLALRRVKKVALIGWSQGGPRTTGYTAAHPEKVSRLVVLAPAYNRAGPLTPVSPLPLVDGILTVQSEADFKANWDRQVGCPGQVDPAAAASVWSELIASDPVGATWSPPVRRAPAVPTWGFNKEVAGKLRTPYLMIAGVLDKQVDPARVRELYEDLGSKEKVLIELACSSHNAMWEKNHRALFKASLDWISSGKVQGVSSGTLKLGD